VALKPTGLTFTFDYPGAGTLDALVTTHKLSASTAALRPAPTA
jgi:hypothetical protein